MTQKALLEQVLAFKRLDRRRAAGEKLPPADEELWAFLNTQLRSSLLGEKAGAGSYEQRRTAIRVPSDLEMVFKDKEAFRSAYIKNISGGGIYVETETPLVLNAEIALKIRIGEDHNLDVKAKVVWINSSPSRHSNLKRGAGMKLLDLTSPQEETIRDLVYSILESKASLEVGKTGDAKK